MRRIGDRPKRPEAMRFAHYLAAQGIETEVRDDDDAFSVWVLDEDRLEECERLFTEFSAAPDDKRFDAVVPAASAAPAPMRNADRGRYIDARTEVFGRGRSQPKVTIFLIVVSALFTYVSTMPGASHFTYNLYFAGPYSGAFAEILDGQVWRIITPIFLHGNVLHLLFNMMWLYQLGGAIESNEGSLYYGAVILVFAAMVNTAQYLVSGPQFIGMSGVVYGLLGYVWMMSKYEASTRYALQQQTVTFMVIWMLICLVGIIPNVANTQHVAGFAIGTVWGFLRSGRISAIRRRQRYRNSL